MQYSIVINQIGIVEAGLHTKTDLIDWAIINYLQHWYFGGYGKKICFTNEGTHIDYVWVNYKHLMENMPLLHIKDKSALSERFKKLKKLGLIKTQQTKDGSLYFILTEFCISTCFYQKKKNSTKTITSETEVENQEGCSSKPNGGVRQNPTAQVVYHTSSNNINNIADFKNQPVPAIKRENIIPKDEGNTSTLNVIPNSIGSNSNGANDGDSAKQANPAVRRIISFFYDLVFKEKGFKPKIDGGDAKAVQRALKDMTEDELKDCIEYNLQHNKEKAKTLKACLSTYGINLYREHLTGRVGYFQEYL